MEKVGSDSVVEWSGMKNSYTLRYALRPTTTAAKTKKLPSYKTPFGVLQTATFVITK